MKGRYRFDFGARLFAKRLTSAKNWPIAERSIGEQQMDTLYSWSARRAGGRITITHSSGKVVGVDTIEPDAEGKVIATRHDGAKFYLAAVPHLKR